MNITTFGATVKEEPRTEDGSYIGEYLKLNSEIRVFNSDKYVALTDNNGKLNQVLIGFDLSQNGVPDFTYDQILQALGKPDGILTMDGYNKNFQGDYYKGLYRLSTYQRHL